MGEIVQRWNTECDTSTRCKAKNARNRQCSNPAVAGDFDYCPIHLWDKAALRKARMEDGDDPAALLRLLNGGA